MPPSENESRPLSSPETWAIAMISLFFGGMMFAALFKEYSVYKLSVPIFILSWAILLVIHEFGHALMSKVLGWKVKKVAIGTGKLLFEKQIFGMPTEFRAIPISGFVQPRPTNLVQPQLKNFLIYAAGPGIEILLVLLLWAAVGTEIMFQRQPNLWLISVQTFSFAAAFGAIMNLIPIPHQSDQGQSPSDGLGMIISWQIPDAQYAKWIEENEDEIS